VLILDHRRVVVEASQPTLRRALKDWGFKACRYPSLVTDPARFTALDRTPGAGVPEDYPKWFTGWQPNCQIRQFLDPATDGCLSWLQ
jgi:hypothetical protein